MWLKRFMIRMVGSITWPRYNWWYYTDIQGAEHIQTLPESNVLFVSNHQTYFADVTYMFHVIEAAIDGRPNEVYFPSYLKVPKANIYFVAAEETMKSGILPKIMALGGALTIKRTWRKDGEDTARPVDKKDTGKVIQALKEGWVISFPPGTTTPFVPGRKGTAHIIQQTGCTVVPLVIDGFRRAFDKKGLKKKKKGVTLYMDVKAPIRFDNGESIDEIMLKVMNEIEQSPKFLKVTETSPDKHRK
jgi:1-acyl-sn-glycerol-3-phosphate acyltransferase